MHVAASAAAMRARAYACECGMTLVAQAQEPGSVMSMNAKIHVTQVMAMSEAVLPSYMVSSATICCTSLSSSV